ncbi:hypothetical protein F0562_000073 [Nyssa sinensis]|uniref:Uncharacterized protein n=1 Tax=Nyssa sinensis TaxID=561372 RepID=A0A5J5BZM3_9ASTE|nr:hypothetical protein F0562_000073 [Nyssa sinensis]
MVFCIQRILEYGGFNGDDKDDNYEDELYLSGMWGLNFCLVQLHSSSLFQISSGFVDPATSGYKLFQ